MKYKYIHIDEVADDIYTIHNNRDNSILGTIDWYFPWKQFVADFQPGCVFNNQCLRDIADFLDQLNKEKGK